MTIHKHGTPSKATVVDSGILKPEKPKGKPEPKPGGKKAGPPEPSKPGPTTPAASTTEAAGETAPLPKAEDLIEVALDPYETSMAQLGQERVLTARLQLDARQKELEGYLLTLKAKYEQGGKFRLKSVDVNRGVLTLLPS